MKRQTTQLSTIIAVSFAITLYSFSYLQTWAGDYFKARFMPMYEDTGSDTFFVYTRGNELSHPILYHDIGRSIDNARQADILLFGNSRTQLGYQESFIVEQTRSLGLKVFNMAVGHADNVRFALDLIRRHDLRPDVMVVSGGPFVFHDGYSDWAEQVVAMTAWEARKVVGETTLGWHFTTLLHRYLPRYDFFNQPLNSQWILYRSRQSGWWRPALEPKGRHPVRVAAEESSYAWTLPLAFELKKELDERGVLLVITMLPYPRTLTGHLDFLSTRLGVPIVLPDLEGAQTADGSHLNRESAARATRNFWQQFIALESVRTKLSLPPAARQ